MKKRILTKISDVFSCALLFVILGLCLQECIFSLIDPSKLATGDATVQDAETFVVLFAVETFVTLWWWLGASPKSLLGRAIAITIPVIAAAAAIICYRTNNSVDESWVLVGMILLHINLYAEGKIAAMNQKEFGKTQENEAVKETKGEPQYNFAVNFFYGFDGDHSTYPFVTEDEAKKFLRGNFEEEVRIDREENGWDVEAEISEDGRHAYIIDHFDNHDDRTDMFISNIYR